MSLDDFAKNLTLFQEEDLGERLPSFSWAWWP
jgi:hypothetical protein